MTRCKETKLDRRKKEGGNVSQNKKQTFTDLVFETQNPLLDPSGPLLVSSTGDAEKTENVREEPKGPVAHPQNLRKAVVCSIELVGGHEGWNPLWNV